MVYIPQTTRPNKDNKYYTRIESGGYSTCILGNNQVITRPWVGATIPNCVGYAGGRFNELIGENKFKYALNCNAEDFITRAKSLGLEIGQTPKLGAIMVWSKGKLRTSSDGVGHVAVVEKIISNTEVLTGESGWSAKAAFWNQNRKQGINKNWGQTTGYKFLGFIYNPAITDDVKQQLRYGDKGIYVKSLQEDLNKIGYGVSIDSSFGNETLNAIKKLQSQYKLTIDGIVGDSTYTLLDKLMSEQIKPEGVMDLKFLLNGKEVTAWAVTINNQNYIRMSDLEKLEIVKSVKYNTTNKKIEVIK